MQSNDSSATSDKTAAFSFWIITLKQCVLCAECINYKSQRTDVVCKLLIFNALWNIVVR